MSRDIAVKTHEQDNKEHHQMKELQKQQQQLRLLEFLRL
jgi:hypothetical protein